MHRRTVVGARRLGIVSVAALAFGFGGSAAAGASPFYGSDHHRANPDAPVASASVANDTLTITGTDGPDNIAISVASGDPNTVNVDLDNDGTTDQHFDRGTFNTVTVLLGAGDDRFAAVGTVPGEAMTVDAGSGDDTITTGGGNDVILAGSGRDVVNSGAGDDLIDAGSGDDLVIGGTGHDTAFLGSGRDSFVWNPGDGSDFVEGDSGTDALVFNGSAGAEQMSLAANGPESVFLRQPGNVRMDMDGVEQLDLTPLGGADTIALNDMTGTDMRRGEHRLVGRGCRRRAGRQHHSKRDRHRRPRAGQGGRRPSRRGGSADRDADHRQRAHRPPSGQRARRAGHREGRPRRFGADRRRCRSRNRAALIAALTLRCTRSGLLTRGAPTFLLWPRTKSTSSDVLMLDGLVTGKRHNDAGNLSPARGWIVVRSRTGGGGDTRRVSPA